MVRNEQFLSVSDNLWLKQGRKGLFHQAKLSSMIT